MPDLSRAIGVSARTLQDGFQRYVGVSPTCYLREVRLQRARADLSNPALCTTVSDTAYRWGFAHLGRFAVAYRNKFGESPSEALHKSASKELPSRTR
ncbi:MAG: helix-turn-helix transcriptional regulator [Mycobacterium sp.]